MKEGIKQATEEGAYDRVAELAEQLKSLQATDGIQVIPPLPSLFTLLRLYLAHFFPVFSRFFARFHRLAETVPTSPKPEPRAKKQPARGPRAPNSALRSTPQVQGEGSPELAAGRRQLVLRD